MSKQELRPCPFCGGECDATGWLRGPECEGCGATAASVEAWNRRAQPAEAEGVEVVGYAVTWIRVGETPEETVFMSTADFEATGGPRFYSYREPLVLQSAHLAALSAVTAERDRVLAEAHGQMVEAFAERDEVIAERDQFRAEVEALERITPEMEAAGKRAIDRAREDGCASIYSLGHVYCEAAISAAMAAKEA